MAHKLNLHPKLKQLQIGNPNRSGTLYGNLQCGILRHWEVTEKIS